MSIVCPCHVFAVSPATLPASESCGCESARNDRPRSGRHPRPLFRIEECKILNLTVSTAPFTERNGVGFWPKRTWAATAFLLLCTTSCLARPAPIYPLPSSSTGDSSKGSAFSTPAPRTPSRIPGSSGPPIPSLTSVPSPNPAPTVQSLSATVTANLLSCRYGPGANYLFLYGLRKGAKIRLIGRTDDENWRWVYLDGASKCWVNASFIEITGDLRTLPVVYPGIAKLPVSPRYPPTSVLSAVRTGSKVTVEWADIPLRRGDEEDALMQHYIIEVWHCEGGHLLFEPFATNDLSATIIDESGCPGPSHARIYVQEKHGFAGPTEIPWPAAN